MKRAFLTMLLAGVALNGVAMAADESAKAKDVAWSMNATAIEACSCPMFCQCYFQTKPAAHAATTGEHAGHGAEHFCRANAAFKVNKGAYGKTKLDGVKVWATMDLGDDFSDGTMKWAVITFDPAVTKEQREGIATILGHLYPVKWEQPMQFGADAAIEWTHTGDKAVAKLDGGKAGEIILNGAAVNRDKSAPTVITNLKYWGAPRNTGFVLMPNEVEAYRLGSKAFEFKGTNGFMITVDINSKDVTPVAGGGGH